MIDNLLFITLDILQDILSMTTASFYKYHPTLLLNHISLVMFSIRAPRAELKGRRF